MPSKMLQHFNQTTERIDRYMDRVREFSEDLAKGGYGGMPAALSSDDVSSAGLQGSGRERHAEQYKHNTGWVFASIRVKALRIARQPFRMAQFLQRRTMNHRQTAQRQFQIAAIRSKAPGHYKSMAEDMELVEQHELLDAMNDPNPMMVRWSLMFVTVASLELTGKAHWWLVKDKKTGKLQIYPLPSHWISPVHDKDGLFSKWTITPPGSFEGYSVPGEEIVYFSYPDPSDPSGALSPLSAQSRAVLTDENISEAQRRAFINSVWPGLAIIIGKLPDEKVAGIANTEHARPVLAEWQREQILSAFKRRMQGLYRINEPMILDGMVQDVKQLTVSNKEMDFLQSGRATKARITQGTVGVNPISMGEIEGANRASAAIADHHLVANSVNPTIELMSQCMTAWLGPRYEQGNKKYVLYIEECSANDPEMDLQRFRFGKESGAISVNHIRQELFGLPPVHGGDVALVPAGLQIVNLVPTSEPDPGKPLLEGGYGSQPPVAEEEAEDIAEEPEEDADADEEASTWTWRKSRPARFVCQKMYLTRDDYSDLWLRTQSAQEKMLDNALRAFFKGIFAEVKKKARELARDNALTPQAVAAVIDPQEFNERLRAAGFVAVKRVVEQGAAQEFLLHKPQTRAAILSFLKAKRKVKPVAPSAVQGVLNDLPQNVRDSITQFVQGLFKQPYWQDMGTNARREIITTIERGLTEGLSNEQIAKDLAGRLDDMGEVRAMRAARTESTGALNYGQQVVREQLAEEGIVKGKEWLSIIDQDTRGTHADADGQQVGVNDKFLVGGQACDYPGDTVLSVEERVNCRCASTSVLDVDERSPKRLRLKAREVLLPKSEKAVTVHVHNSLVGLPQQEDTSHRHAYVSDGLGGLYCLK